LDFVVCREEPALYFNEGGQCFPIPPGSFGLSRLSALSNVLFAFAFVGPLSCLRQAVVFVSFCLLALSHCLPTLGRCFACVRPLSFCCFYFVQLESGWKRAVRRDARLGFPDLRRGWNGGRVSVSLVVDGGIIDCADSWPQDGDSCNTMLSFYQRRPELSNEMAPVKSAAAI
jgi:hypothetical protein